MSAAYTKLTKVLAGEASDGDSDEDDGASFREFALDVRVCQVLESLRSCRVCFRVDLALVI